MRHTRTRVAAVACSTLLLAATAACAAKSSSTSSAGGTSASGSSAGGSCGTIPTKAYSDPDGVVASLPSDIKSAYDGYTTTVYKSVWANWKPKHTGTYTVGISVSALSNPYQIAIYNLLKSDLAAAGIKVVALVSTNSATDQIQQFEQLIEEKVDLIVYQPLSPTAFGTVVDQATAAGIPSISILNETPDKNTINLASNAWYQGAEMAAYLAKSIGGSGKVLGVHGIPGVGIDTDTFAGFKAAFALCSGISLDDSVTGQFSDATTKTQVQEYLSTHPETIKGVVLSGTMAAGVIKAFEQAGKTVPMVTDDSLEEASLAYWYAHQSSYTGVGITTPAAGLAAATTTIAKDMLAGDGIKISSVVVNPPLVTKENLSQWVEPSWTENSSGTANGPSGFTLTPSSLLDAVFTTTPTS